MTRDPKPGDLILHRNGNKGDNVTVYSRIIRNGGSSVDQIQSKCGTELDENLNNALIIEVHKVTHTMAFRDAHMVFVKLLLASGKTIIIDMHEINYYKKNFEIVDGDSKT